MERGEVMERGGGGGERGGDGEEVMEREGGDEKRGR